MYDNTIKQLKLERIKDQIESLETINQNDKILIVNVNLKMYKYGEMKLYNYGGLVLSSVLIITAIY